MLFVTASGQTNSQANKYGTKVLVRFVGRDGYVMDSLHNSDSPMRINDLSAIGSVDGYDAKILMD